MDRRRRKTREAILQAFVRLFFERGYDAVTMDAIAAAADVGRSTLYTHFPRKEELLAASLAPHLSDLADSVTPNGGERLGVLMRHLWDNRRHRNIFAPGACRNLLAGSLAEMIDQRLRGPQEWRVPRRLAARLIADHQLNLLDLWLSGHAATGAPAMTETMTASAGALRAGLQRGPVPF
jgi:AcrR family transcriptional regulator